MKQKNKIPQKIQQQLTELVSCSVLYEKEQVSWTILAREIDKTCRVINQHFIGNQDDATI